MSRWVIAIALSWSAWAVQQPAVAHARSSLSSELGPAMCGEGAQTLLPEELTLGRALSQLPPQSAAAADERATAAVSGVRAAALASGVRLAATQDDGPPAWCISPDDPRCAPRDQSSPMQGPRAHVPMQDVTVMRWPELAAESGSAQLRPLPLGAARPGIGMRLDRPPRAR
ncbi:MAG TPA: hypothetical protein VFN67_35160 [Polyangiales bacterium]|nr:hypothetical protein [Polyangiales bacterium]